MDRLGGLNLLKKIFNVFSPFFWYNLFKKAVIKFMNASAFFKFTVIFSYILSTLVLCPYLDRKLWYFMDNDEFWFYYFVISASCVRIVWIWLYYDLKKISNKSEVVGVELSSGRSKFFWKFNRTVFHKLKFFFLQLQNKFIQKSSLIFNKFIFFINFSKIILILRKLWGLVVGLVIWRPIFKRLSYFGLYKSVNSKNLNK